MSYRLETDKESGEKQLVISGWEKGIADSPYLGITSIRNLNVSFLAGAAYVNYKRKVASKSESQTFTAVPSTFTVGTALTLATGDAVKFTGGSLPTGITAGVIYFVQSVPTVFTFTVSATLGGGAVTLSGNGSGTVTSVAMGRPKFFTQSPGSSPTYYILDDKGQVWKSSQVATWQLVTGNHTSTGSLGYGIAYFKDYLFVFGSDYVDVCGDGTGTGAIISTNWADVDSTGYYFKNLTLLDMTGAPAVGATSLTLSAVWPYTTGSYQVIIGTAQQTVTGTFTYGSATVPITPAVSVTTAVTTISVNLFTITSPANHMSLVGINDVLYFTNGNTIGAISVPDTSPTAVFKVSDFTTQQVEFSALKLRETDRAVWLEELNSQLVIAVSDYIYYWDKVGTEFTAAPINEDPSKMINILNNIYIFAGQKGNIYITNGYSVSLFKKIPDSFVGIIDPYWVIGGMMFHRNKLFFGAVGGQVGGSTAVQGVFSLTLVGGSSSHASETPGAINFESQNSYGLTPSTAADGTNILIDGNSYYGTGLGAGVTTDVYVSAFYNNSVGYIDYNDTTLWQNFEPAIETDLIPMGSLLTGGTLAQIEFKLDRPMASGDQIRMSYRKHFTDTYVLMGTTTSAVLSDIYNTGINEAQWVQFKVEFKCASSSSSFIPLREIRLHYGN